MANTLGGVFSPGYRDVAQEERDEHQRAKDIAGMSLGDLAAYSAYTGGRGAVQGVGQALGVDQRSDARKHADAVSAAKAEAAKLGFDPDDPASVDKFYKAVIQILQRQGLVAEAMAVAKEYQANKVAQQKATTGAAAVEQRRAAADARAAAANERNAIARAKLGTSGPEVIQLLANVDRMRNEMDALPEGDPRRDAIEANIQRLLARASKLSEGQGVKVVDLGDRVQIVDAGTGKSVREEEKGAAPLSAKDEAKEERANAAEAAAYASMKANIQNIYNAAAKLYSLPGLSSITGRLGTLFEREEGPPAALEAMMMDAGREAYASVKQVKGATFLAGLEDLKRANEKGTSGLGQVTEREGAKVENAKAALRLSQPTESFRTNLKTYIDSIVNASKLMDEKAQAAGISVRPLQEVPLTVPGARQPRTSSPAPSAKPAPMEDEYVRMVSPDGKTGKVKRSEVEAAKAAGYTEAR